MLGSTWNWLNSWKSHEHSLFPLIYSYFLDLSSLEPTFNFLLYCIHHIPVRTYLLGSSYLELYLEELGGLPLPFGRSSGDSVSSRPGNSVCFLLARFNMDSCPLSPPLWGEPILSGDERTKFLLLDFLFISFSSKMNIFSLYTITLHLFQPPTSFSHNGVI